MHQDDPPTLLEPGQAGPGDPPRAVAHDAVVDESDPEVVARDIEGRSSGAGATAVAAGGGSTGREGEGDGWHGDDGVPPVISRPIEIEGPAAHPTADGSGVDRGALILGGLRGLAAWSWRFLLVVAALAVVLYLIAQVWIGVLPILLALIISSVLWPPVRWLRERRVPAALASLLVVLAGLGLLAGVVAGVSPAIAGQGREVIFQAGAGIDAILDWVAGPPLNLQSEQVNEYVQQATSWVQSQAGQLASGALATLTTVGTILTQALLALVLTFFFLKDGPNFLPWLRRTTGRTAGMHLTEALARVWTTLGGFLRGQAIVAGVDAVFIGIGLLVLSVPLAIPLAIITFLLAFIPILGAFVAGALAVLVALVSQGFTVAVWTLVLVVGVQQAESAFVSPTVQSRTVSLHPVLVLLGVAAGTALWGILGAFLAVPVIACVLAAMRYGSEQLDLRTGEIHVDDVKSLTPEGEQAAKLAEQSAPVFQLRARQAYQQAEDERGAASVAMLGRTTELAASFRDRFITPILRRGDDEDGTTDQHGRSSAHPDRATGGEQAGLDQESTGRSSDHR